mgnify:CR=1 FL=1
MKISSIINYCTNDQRFINKCINSVRPVSYQVIVTYTSCFYDGSAENYDLIRSTIIENPDVIFVEIPYEPNKYNESESGNNQQPKDPKIDVNFTENPTVKPLQPYVGDVLIAGRYGNSIRFSTTPKSGKFTVQPNWSGGSESAPITIFRNSKQGIDTKQINDYITEDFTNEENVIVQASGQNIIFEQGSGVTTSTFMIGSSNVGFAFLPAVLKPALAHNSNDIASESTSWYEPSNTRTFMLLTG